MNWKFYNDRPIWSQVADQLKFAIASGRLQAGERLPSVRELADEAGVNPNTVQKALSQLEAEGLADGNRTAGRTVTKNTELIGKIQAGLAKKHIDEYLTSMKQLGYEKNEAIEILREDNT